MLFVILIHIISSDQHYSNQINTSLRPDFNTVFIFTQFARLSTTTTMSSSASNPESVLTPSPQAISDMLAAYRNPVSTTHFVFKGVTGIDVPSRIYYNSRTSQPRIPVAPRLPKFWTTEEESVALHKKYDDERAEFSKAMELYAAQDPTMPTPSLILTHGRGSTLDHSPTNAFALGFARHSPALGFEFISDDLNARATVFRALLNHYPGTPAFGGRSAGSRAAARAVSYTSVKNLILFTVPLVRGLEMRDEELCALSADTNVLIVSGNDDPLSIEIILRAVRKRMRARTWWIKLHQADHKVEYLETKDKYPDRAARICDVAGQIAAKWLGGERDEKKTEMTIGWDLEIARPTVTPWTEMVPDKKREQTLVDVNFLNAGMFGGGGSFSFAI
jgi:hypothetical protein